MPNPAYRCNLLVIACIDFRIQPLVSSFIHEQFPGEMYDYAAYAGSVKNLHITKEQVEVSRRLHNVQKIILIEHEDCGAYGIGQHVREMQIQDLQKAKKYILYQYPNLEVYLFYLRVSGICEEIPDSTETDRMYFSGMRLDQAKSDADFRYAVQDEEEEFNQ